MKDEKVKDEKVKENTPASDGLVVFTREGVTIRRPAEQANALVKLGWVRA